MPNLMLSDKTHARLKIISAVKGVSMTQIVEEQVCKLCEDQAIRAVLDSAQIDKKDEKISFE